MARFVKGRSGNSHGRPPGIADKRTLFKNMLEPHKEALLNKAITMALEENNEAMLRLLLDKLLPRAKDPGIEINLQKGNFLEQCNEIIEGLCQGRITASEAKTLTDTILNQCKIIEALELEKRLTALEEAVTVRNSKLGRSAS